MWGSNKYNFKVVILFWLAQKEKLSRKSKRTKQFFWNGGKYIDRLNGYVKVHSPDHPSANNRGYIFEHRLVMEKSLGRYLRKNEIIHHRNKRKDDNRADNLELIVLGEVKGGDVMCPHCNKIFKLS
jgi:hypothetical protein